MHRIKRWGGIAAAAVLLIGLTWRIAAAQGSGIPVTLDDQYGLTLPAGYQVAQQDTGFLAAGTTSIGLAIYSPTLVNAPAAEPLNNVLMGAGGALLPDSPLDESGIVTAQIDGRDVVYIDTQEAFQGANYNVRLYALRMSDGTVGVVNVIALNASASPADFVSDIEAVLASFDVLPSASESPTPTTVTEASPTPKYTATPTITPTPGPLTPQDGAYTLSLTGSDSEATCSVGFFPLEAALPLLTYSGSLVASNDGRTVDFTVDAGNSAADQNIVHLERQANSNQFTGSASNIQSDGGVRWSVNLRLELVEPGRFTGHPTGSFLLTDGQTTIHCADNTAIELQANN
ncbi:MAG: hypothetical protein U0670_11470 [Anaerolineae bacterium]